MIGVVPRRLCLGGHSRQQGTYAGLQVVGKVGRFSKFRTSYRPEPMARAFLPPWDLTHLVPQFSAEIEKVRLSLFSRHELLDTLYDEELEIASRKMARKYASYYPGSHWTVDDAIARMREFCSDTSPGWSWTSEGFRTKAQVLDSPEALARVINSVGMYLSGHFQWLPWSDALKDELLKRAKVENGDTRLFVVAPPEHYLASAVVFGAFQENIFRKWKHLNSCCAGATLEYGGYLDILKRFEGKTRFFCTDAKHQDVSISPVLAWFALRPLIEAMPEMYRRSAFVLVTEMLYCAVITSEGFIVLKNGGNPSGGFLTLLLNILVQELLWTACHSHGECLCEPSLAIVGDDAFVGTHEGCPLLDRAVVLSFFQQHGLTLEIDGPSSSLWNLEWCGKSLVVHGDDVAIVPREAKMKSACFFVKSRDPVKIVSRLVGLYRHLIETDFAEPLRRMISAKIEKHRLTLAIPSIRDCMVLRYGQPVRLNVGRFKIGIKTEFGIHKESQCLHDDDVTALQMSWRDGQGMLLSDRQHMSFPVVDHWQDQNDDAFVFVGAPGGVEPGEALLPTSRLRLAA